MEPVFMAATFTITKLEPVDFNQLIAQLSPLHIPIEQTPQWGIFDNALSGRQYLGSWRYDEDDRLIAMASATLYSQKGRDWLWIKHGPIFTSLPNTEVIKKMCATLQQQFLAVNNKQPLFIRLSMPQPVKPLTPPFEHTMYDQTVVLDLQQAEADLFAQMSQSGRQGVRKALKSDVTIQQVLKPQAKQIFKKDCYPILSQTGERGGFGIHPSALYETMLEKLPEAQLYTASHDGSTVAWAIITEHNGQVLYYYGASNNLARETSAPYLLHWEIIKTMRQRSNHTYDFMGIASKHYPSLANVSQFKLKFSKQIVQLPLSYDLPLQGLKYRMLAIAIKTKRRLL